MGSARIAVRQTGNKVTTYLTTAGSKERMKKIHENIDDYPQVKKAKKCLTGLNSVAERKNCLRKL